MTAFVRDMLGLSLIHEEPGFAMLYCAFAVMPELHLARDCGEFDHSASSVTGTGDTREFSSGRRVVRIARTLMKKAP